MSTQAGLETEVKIPLADAAAVRGQIEAVGFRVSVARSFESNTIYDTADQALRQASMLLRLRQTGARCVVTWKGPGVPGPHKSRPEIETTVGSLESLDGILRQLGYLPLFRYEKYRTEFTAAHETGSIVLDETPIGDFLELEGTGDWIDETAQRLGFSQQDYVLESYGKLYLNHCVKHDLHHSHMVFAKAVL
ncbi:MAG TPA: class IV adenylate cyclase [Bryobacteraceae bacterium]|nr:class IV adenylate cyclase [Bryobacteraceae bacterium]HTF70794.1 class IV adenylate cyclase [Edaphobacter sp.]